MRDSLHGTRDDRYDMTEGTPLAEVSCGGDDCPVRAKISAKDWYTNRGLFTPFACSRSFAEVKWHQEGQPQ